MRLRRLSVIAMLVAAGLVGCAPRDAVDGSASEPLPGASSRSPELVARLRDAVAELGDGYRPRTHHLRPDGSARYTNRLILERSPYLRQHAHNPVDWYPWGDEVFARAKAEGKPILLSIGYATCHWCHVMEEESFEDEEIAARLNADYVAIKVDREARPDVDATYLQAVMLMTGGGGWPMTIWLTPDREVFFGGTYFPPRDGVRGARIGFLSLLRQIADAHRADPAGLVARGRELTARVRALADVEPAAGVPGRTVLDAAFAAYRSSFDEAFGGFGRAPKFPMPASFEFLLRYHRRTQEPSALTMVRRTLDQLDRGGILDQIGGGFHRYATDRAWQIPHFEKMLYDNAQLASLYLNARQATGDPRFAEVARGILEDLLRTFRAPGGGFYSAIDADDPGGEGAFYTWTPAEVDAVLPAELAAAARAYFGVDASGNFDGRTVLHVARDSDVVAAELGVDQGRFRTLVTGSREKLLTARARRPAPLVDTKVLVAWNGLAISAFARAGATLAEPRYVNVAIEAAKFVLAHLRPQGRLQRVYAGGAAGQPAFLDDYAFLAAGFLDLYEATFDLGWLREAEALHATLADEFWDDDSGGFFTTSVADTDSGLPRTKSLDDGALPSGNAVAAENLLRLATFRDDDRARQRATECLRALGRALTRVPTSAPRLLGVLEALLDRPREIVIVEPAEGDEGSTALQAVVRSTFLPNRAFVVAREGSMLAAAQAALPFVGEKRAVDGLATAYVCERGRCLAPTSDPATLARQLAQVQPLPALDQKGD
ncbi:MAG: thioredoxin domain-containing protein [Candidatus Binatia bacterium]